MARRKNEWGHHPDQAVGAWPDDLGDAVRREAPTIGRGELAAAGRALADGEPGDLEQLISSPLVQFVLRSISLVEAGKRGEARGCLRSAAAASAQSSRSILESLGERSVAPPTNVGLVATRALESFDAGHNEEAIAGRNKWRADLRAAARPKR